MTSAVVPTSSYKSGPPQFPHMQISIWKKKKDALKGKQSLLLFYKIVLFNGDRRT